MKRHIRRARYFFIAFLALFFFGGRPVEFGKENSFFHGFLIPNPVIKIGLGVNLSDIEIASSSGMKVYEVNRDYRLVSDDAQGVRIKGRREKLSEKFVILIAHAQERKEAEIMARDLEAKLGRKVYVEENKEDELGGSFEVKVGDFLTRGEALAFIKELNAAGVSEAWILTEEVTVAESKPLWILVNDQLQNLTEETVLYFIPANQESCLSFNGRSYRGIFILRSSRKGMALVNLLNVEDYLKGVVPNELSPSGFNEIEALKAQAVAARTYAIKNLGENQDLGFDLWNTAKSQVYRGIDSELPMSNKAVDETKGEVVLYRGALINALYTSTCGGRTENSENVFGGKAVPYLRSTVCVYEKKPEWAVETEREAPARAQVFGNDISLEIASLTAFGVIPGGSDPVAFREMVQPEEAAEWIRKALAVLGPRAETVAYPAPAVTFATLAPLIVRVFHWGDRVHNLLIDEEVAYITEKQPGLAAADRENLAYLVWAEVFPPLDVMGSPDRALSRGELIHALYKVLTSSKDLSHYGTVEEIGRDDITVMEDLQKRTLRVPPEIFLVRDYLEGHSFPVSLSLWPGDRVRWLERDGIMALLEVAPSPDTNVLDRTSTFHRWQVRRSREELEKLVNQYYPVGRLVDIFDQKRGESGRVAELLVVGGEGQTIVTGLKVRYVLGLKDTLFAIDREYDGEGKVAFFTFSGKGWGHGVGLCQVGAFGMAQQGARYQEILKKYYQGVKIDKAY
jgi:stage II sporulation protein D